MARDRTHPEISLWRLLPLWVGMLALFGVLGFRLWNLQVAQGTEYQRRLAKQSLRSVRLPGIRGRIYDRNGVALADNRPSYCVSLFLEEFRQSGGLQRTVDRVMEALYRLAEAMDQPLQLGPHRVKFGQLVVVERRHDQAAAVARQHRLRLKPLHP